MSSKPGNKRKYLIQIKSDKIVIQGNFREPLLIETLLLDLRTRLWEFVRGQENSSRKKLKQSLVELKKESVLPDRLEGQASLFENHQLKEQRWFKKQIAPL